MSTENMWGDLRGIEAIRTPVTYLKEQGKILSELTNGLLIGVVTGVESSRGQFGFALDIVAPALNDYTYTLLTMTYPLAIYPLLIQDYTRNKVFRCQNEEDFLVTLENALASPETRAIIQSLMSQSKA